MAPKNDASSMGYESSAGYGPGYGPDYGPGPARPEDLQMVRQDLIGEITAINDYERHAAMASDPRIAQMFRQIANDEKHHVAELMHTWMRSDRELMEQMRRVMNGM